MLKSSYTETLIEAGCDEAGRGPLAGPVVAAAVILPKDYRHTWLNDSKTLNKEKRECLKTEIEKDAISWAVAVVDNQKIDEINILKASFLAMHQAVAQLDVTPALLLIDGNRFTPYPDIPHECIIKGDGKFLSIAAASILAKTHRDQLMEKLANRYPEYGWDKNAGYPTKAHRQAIEKFGPTLYHRRSFRLLPAPVAESP
ncbi:ribonuclease HII [Fulvivirgaceae bacterium BMA12]|uniref:Ribonuclease HII n=1 Tax=Agaribacillus aureus TaxID=3051825 RepID=A0ABT8LI39_9BACT|nr:ribonuclease HII [Fulvivirgaceae bacterium BMA12]